MGKEEGERERGWYTAAEVSAILDITTRAFREGFRKHVPDAAYRDAGPGRTALIYFRGLWDASHEYRIAQAMEKVGGEDAALLAGGGDSPALERLRAAKAKLAEMDVEERARTHLNLGTMETGLSHLASVIRRTSEEIRRKFGNEPADMLEEGINEFSCELDTYFANLRRGNGSDSADNGDAEHAAPADDAAVRRAGNHPADRPV